MEGSAMEVTPATATTTTCNNDAVEDSTTTTTTTEDVTDHAPSSEEAQEQTDDCIPEEDTTAEVEQEDGVEDIGNEEEAAMEEDIAPTAVEEVATEDKVLRMEDVLGINAGGDAHKSIEVAKEVEPVVDVGSLYMNDLQPVDVKKLRADRETFLHALARDNAQLLFNKVWQLPIEKVDNVIVCKLPAPTAILPREKKIPKPKPPTKWETFAAKQGIANKKRGRMIFDEETKEWKPRFGYKRGKDDTNEWCLEVPDNAADPNECQFEKRIEAKKERVAKNELQRLHNIKNNMKATGGNDGKTGPPDKKKLKEELKKDIDLAKVSTASLGKFQAKLPKEKENKNRGKKRTFESVAPSTAQSEKDRALDVWNKINTKKPTMDVTRGVNKQIANEQRTAAQEKKNNKSGKVKNKRFRKGAQAHNDKEKTKKQLKGKTLGKKR